MGDTRRGKEPRVAPQGSIHGDRDRRLTADLITPRRGQIGQREDVARHALLRKPLHEIRRKIRSKERRVRSIAQEALAFKLMRFVDMTYVATRRGGSANEGAEVVLIFDSARPVFARWQVQCTTLVSLDEVAKAVGLSVVLKSNAVVMVSTSEIDDVARRYANKIMADSNLSIVMIDGHDLDCIDTQPGAIVAVFHRESQHAMKLKTIQTQESTR